MDPIRNPYSPGAGIRPAALVGRDAEQDTWKVALQRAQQGRPAQSVVLYGLRGVGKTVLLSRFAKLAEDADWIVGMCEAGGKPLPELLAQALHEPLRDLARPTATTRVRHALRTFLNFKASYTTAGEWTFGLDLDPTDTPVNGSSGDLDTDLSRMIRELAQAGEETGTGLALLIDEAQDLTLAELGAITAVVHQAGQRELPLLIGLAGLPSLPRILAEARSYAERLYTFHVIQRLPEPVALAALADPARQEGVSWREEAAAFIVEQTQGYPYFLQAYGQQTWNATETADATIRLPDARLGAAYARAELDTGFFRARWDRATRSEQDYLRAMAVDADAGSASGTVAARLGRKVTSLGPTRAQLIQKGLIYAPEHGIVAFTVPAMADFINRQPT